MPGFNSILGLQFQNLILRNRTELYKFLDLNSNQIVSAAPYVQRKLSSNSGGCQIDLLINSKLDVFYPCEMKCRTIITASVITEMKKKLSVLKLPKRSAVKPVLVYAGKLSEEAEEDIRAFFYKVVGFGEMV